MGPFPAVVLVTPIAFLLTFLGHSPLLLLALLLLLGALLGRVHVKGISLGPAAVLFVAIALSAWGVSQGVELTVPEVLGNFGLMLFTYTVGIVSGPNFFGSLRRGWPAMLTTLACLALAALVTGGGGAVLGLPKGVTAGAFAGGLTNTPALAAAGEATGNAELPAIGYSISYLWGVAGMMIAAAWAIRRGKGVDGAATDSLEQRTIRVDRDERASIGEILNGQPSSVSATRVQHYHEATLVASPGEHLHKGDLISVVGPKDSLTELTRELGHTSSVDIIGDRTYLDSNRVTLSEPALAGHQLRDLGLETRFGAQVSRVRRGDVDMIPGRDFIVQMGDRLRIVAPRDRIKEIRAHLGDSERGFSEINPLGLTLGLAIGVAIGMIQIPLPHGSFTIGAAAGTLIVGLIFGRLGNVGRLPVATPTAAANALSSLGMLIFLAYAGTKAGLQFVSAVSSSLGWKVALLGFITTCVGATTLLIAAKLHRTNWTQVAGQLAGAQTQPAILAFAHTRTSFDTRVSLGYALVYPTAMVGKILLAQALVLIG